MKIVTWNIAGGHKSRSVKRFDYHDRDLDYFIEQIRQINADVVCLQEVEYSDVDDLATQIAKSLDMPHVFETRMHKSHITPGFGISLAIISRKPFTSQRAVDQPYPTFPLHLPDGRPDQVHKKYLQVVEVDGLQIANVQAQPLAYMGTPYESDLGKTYADELCDFFIKELAQPLVFVGDFNADPSTTHVANIYKKACDSLQLSDTLPPGQTRPNNRGRPDAIFISSEIKKLDSGIIQTETDHFLCWAEVSLLKPA